ncbi:choline dehydrogenase, a flavoprotein; alcohol dehydrogenase [Bradyrhizobium sp. ORS 285]|uniref:GMC family oxidoreductase n=1 Tax=Bradyrhizobium sp. ORS 285 TaxID=115808 RepID=UPI0002406D89|nr:choline dehydrogenase [Bradyrhizobium sp. ORS 285]CCD87850.1 choline dehydrogenase, a flavoprotein; alcohol dehydrogenase [Bradyrhizobium sp. ORS 285]SMX60227.1 choline dehydrogenase, a flavoprotein; alcohol dehydrogenase [Bradyrhizobium sp. ORS 285]
MEGSVASDDADLEFDYVVVGAGSAGCVLANRLSSDGKHKVLLLEAGPKDTNIWIHVPLGYGKLFKEKTVNWMYQTEPEPGLDGRSVFQPRGKVLGGSSSINGLLYVRGQHEDYDRWRQRGNVGWGYDDVLPYFKRAENQSRGGDDYHGVGGPLPVSDWRHDDPLSEAFVKAAVEAGLPFNADFNGASQEGVGFFQTTTRRGRRASSAVSYLRPALGRSNLHVETDALAQRILFEGRRASGITFSQRGRLRTARARKEILVSSGAYNSPQLLQLSGVGPGELLRQHGIDVVLDAPGVGSDLQDHLQVRIVMRCSQRITLNDIVNHPVRKVLAGARYAAFRKGPLTIAAGTAGAFFKTDPRLASPDIQIHFIPFSTDKMGEKLHTFSGFTASVCQLRPESRGSLRIRSADPVTPPEIRINYLASETDRRANIDGLRILRKILAAPALRPYVSDEAFPGPKVVSDDDILAYCRQTGSTIYHPTSTCRMGTDALAVVDQRLRVRGVDGLRVVDASIMPDLVSGNTNAPVIMIAEKASDMILQDAR